jgi:para-nitrobenzyl esterase
VIVWIHGGGYSVGSGDDEPASLAERGVVVVTFNYRLGLLGFLAHPALTAESPHHASGNYGVLDQIAALRWVQSNIAAFGGDRERVTILGHSAGAGAVLQLLASPLARDLAHRAIAHSSTLGRSRPLRDAEQAGVAIATKLGVPADAPLPALRAVPVEQLIGAVGFGAEATTDGWVLPVSAPEAIRTGSLDRVPLIIGAAADEGDIFPIPALDRDAYEAEVRTADPARADRVLAMYPAGADPVAAMRRYMTERDFVCPAHYAATRRGGRTWLFRFSLRSSARIGAFHGAELPLLFGSQGGPHSAAAARAAEAMRRYWVRFATTGAPNEPGLPVWPTYREAPARHLEIGDRVEVSERFERPGCAVLDEAWAIAL